METSEDKSKQIETTSGQNNGKSFVLEPLSVKHEKVQVFILGGETPTAAYRQVYECDDNTARRSSTRLMHNDHFKAHLTQRREALADANNLNSSWVLKKLKHIAEVCLEKGKNFNPAAANKALELIGKHFGTFDKDATKEDERPAFVGISINMGNGTVKMISAGDKDPPFDITPKSKLSPA